jgi:hypothetical protein
MRKIALLFVTLLSVFTLTACLAGPGREEVVVTIPDALPNEPITIEI